jgi:Zn-dependent protease
MTYTLGLGRLFGIPVRVHATFPLILLVYAAGAWRAGSAVDALRAVLLVLAVFGCVVLHELGHSLRARRYGVRVRDIVLFPVGGVARADSIPERPRHEIEIAIAGPIVNFAIALILFGGLALTKTPPHGDGFWVDLAWVNLIIGLFNLIPAFPMDGGRILRAALATRTSYLAATRRARDLGQLIALVFLVAALLDPSFVMLAVVAMFVFVGGMLEEQAVGAKVILSGRRVGELVDVRAPVLAAGDRVETAAARARACRSPAFAIASESGNLVGVVTTPDLMRALRDGRADAHVVTVARRDFPVAEAGTEAERVYRYLRDARKSTAAVVAGERFLGLFHASDLARRTSFGEATAQAAPLSPGPATGVTLP